MGHPAVYVLRSPSINDIFGGGMRPGLKAPLFNYCVQGPEGPCSLRNDPGLVSHQYLTVWRSTRLT